MAEYNNDIPDEFTLKSVSEESMRYRKANRVFENDNGKGCTGSDCSGKVLGCVGPFYFIDIVAHSFLGEKLRIG
ncbi:hypothetical protein E4U38_006612 [Claviceps purpurea]|nr:hypothetical protein E4U38_006612 [Claviceps purpurea]KAG6291534.1 hypothetical protein E4U46_001011 [Claviceps purpurea]